MRLYITITELAEQERIDEGTIHNMVKRKTLPPPIDRKGKPWRWCIATLEKFHWYQIRQEIKSQTPTASVDSVPSVVGDRRRSGHIPSKSI